MALTKNDEAVSPVIGVILMVAVTVILAAVIASFVFGMSGNVEKTKVVAATVQTTTTGGIDITYQGGQDDSTLRYITISAPNSTSTFYTSNIHGSLTLCPSAGCSTASDQKKPDVGALMKLYHADDWPLGQKHVIVVGVFNDGANQVILDTMV